MSRLDLIKQVHMSMKRSTINKNFYNSINKSIKTIDTIGVENAPHIDWKKDCDDITSEIKEQIFG